VLARSAGVRGVFSSRGGRLPPEASALGANLEMGRERVVYLKVPTFLCGNTPATIGGLEGASSVDLLFFASVEFLYLACPREDSPGPHMKDREGGVTGRAGKDFGWGGGHWIPQRSPSSEALIER